METKKFPRREHPHLADRNASIRCDYIRGGRRYGYLTELARKYGISNARVHQILYGRTRAK